jgi:hypothetical protein
VHTECNFHTHCDFDMHDCDFNTHGGDFCTQSVLLKRMSVIMALMGVITTRTSVVSTRIGLTQGTFYVGTCGCVTHECNTNTFGCGFCTQSVFSTRIVILTRTSVITPLMTVIS